MCEDFGYLYVESENELQLYVMTSITYRYSLMDIHNQHSLEEISSFGTNILRHFKFTGSYFDQNLLVFRVVEGQLPRQ